ncbi:hypothetical protein XELAEV_18040970mg [Xenopus laevis]|uniref:Ig-like domain-containing protein n=1 Tax=Xenopus laevis TaxID=8355 RepID=A0A974CAS1_XENLA|nr:hypothetical protein XELAEV_18040970mg [Xenopus laevis]
MKADEVQADMPSSCLHCDKVVGFSLQPPFCVTVRVLILLLCVTGGICGVVQTEKSITAVLGMDVTLPCYYQAEADEKVAQVVWTKKGMNGQNMDIVILNTEYGANIFGTYEGRVKEKAPSNPTDGGIILKNAGEGKSLVASCTAEGNPVPTVIWETEVEGTNSTHNYNHQRSASVTSEFYVVPTRRMNGKALTCVVSHPGFQQEKRITHVLGVRYLGEILIQGHEDGWFVGKEGATLQCQAEGNPPPTYTWSRLNGSLPAEIKTVGNTLHFLRGLGAEDAGVYECQATNGISRRSTRATVSISGNEELSTLSRQASRRRLNSTTASTDTRLQLEEGIHLRSGMHCDSLRDPSISSMMGEEADRRSYSTLTTLKETETQTELLSTVPDEEMIEVGEETEQVEQSQEKESNPTEVDGTVGVANQPFIKQGMSHFHQENGTLRAKPSANGIYINGRGHLV